jgi:hypothetical protein
VVERSAERAALPFSALLDVLRARGVRVGLHDYAKLGRLLCRYDGTSRQQLRSALAALLGRDSRDQVLIGEVFDELFGTGEETVRDGTKDVPPLGRRRVTLRARSSRVERLWWLGSALIVSAATVLVWTLAQPVARPAVPMRPNLPLPAPFTPPAVAPGFEPAATPPPPVPQADERRWRPALAVAGAVFTVLAISGAALRGRSLQLRRRRRGWRSVLAGLPGPQFYRLDPGQQSYVIPRHVVDEVATVLTRRRERLAIGRHLDVPGSLRQTLRAGLFPHLLFMPPCRILPIVVLQDVGSEMRPWRGLVDRFLFDLERQGVPLDRYFFDQLADRVTRLPFGSTLALDSLASSVDDAALLVISTGPGVLKGLSAPPHQSWLTTLKRWPRRSWVVPLENLVHGRPELALVPMRVWPMTAGGLHAMAAELAEEEHRRRDIRPEVVTPARRVTADDVERMERVVVMAPMPVSVELVELLRARFCPDVPRDVIVHLLARSESLATDSIVFTDAERSRLVAAQLRDSSARALAVRQYLKALMDRSEPPTNSAAYLRWEADRALLMAQINESGPGRSESELATLRALASGPLRDELTERVQSLPAGPKLVRQLKTLRVLPDRPLPGERRRVSLAWPAPGHVAGAWLGALAAIGVLVALDAVPVRAVEHVQDAFVLEWVPDPTGGRADLIERGLLRIAASKAQQNEPAIRFDELPVALYRDGASVGDTFQIVRDQVLERRLEGSDLGHWYQLRAQLGRGRLAISNHVWVPGQPAPGAPVPVVIDAAPWARVRVFEAVTGAEINAPNLVTPFVIELPEGEYFLQLENDGLTSPTKAKIVVRIGDPTTFRVVMPGFDPEALIKGTLAPSVK